MNTIYIVPIEPIDARYTKQWYDNIPVILKSAIAEQNLDLEVITVDGTPVAEGTTSGAFLDFAATNVYKSSQTEQISAWFSQGKIRAGDKFLVTDAWNFAITAIKYMSDLLNIPVEIHGIWHAGAYDPTDILGFKMQKPWPWHQETAWFHCCDYNYYATDFHKRMFLENLSIPAEFHHKAVRSGQPHTPIIEQCGTGWSVPKQEIMIWPHRYNSDKQPDIVEDLRHYVSADTMITQKMNLDKSQYYDLLSKCSVIFSCSLHENLGISIMEAVLSGVIPVLPNRCSYSEMYLPEFLYPAEWTENQTSYRKNRDALVEFVNDRIQNRDKYLTALEHQRQILIEDYLQPTIMVQKLLA